MRVPNGLTLAMAFVIPMSVRSADSAEWSSSGRSTGGAEAPRSNLEKPLDSRLADVLDVRDFGAKGDGGADDTPAIQASIDAAGTSGGRIVLLPKGNYRTTGALYMRSGVTLTGTGADSVIAHDRGYGTVTARSAIVWQGSYSDYPTKVSTEDLHPTALIGIASATKGATSITARPSGGFANIGPGDWILITEGPAPKWNQVIQWSRVLVKSGDTLKLARPLDFTFGASGHPFGITRIAPVRDAWVRNLTIRTTSLSSWAFNTGLALRGGIDHAWIDSYLDSESRNVITPYANDAHLFQITNNVFLQGNFGGFNRSSYCTFSYNALPHLNANTGQEHGEGASFCSVSHNSFAGALVSAGSDPIIGVGGVTGLDISDNDFVGGAPAAYVIKIDGGSGRIVNNRIRSAAFPVAMGIAAGYSSGSRVSNWLVIGNSIELAAGSTQPAISIAEYPNCKDIVVAGNDLGFNNGPYGYVRVGDGTVGADRRTIWIYGNNAPGEAYPTYPLGFGAALGTHHTYPPTAGSYEAGSRYYVHDTSNGKHGVRIIQSGTFGTLNGGATTGSITNGSTTLTVNNATGLVEGKYITILGVAGVKRVTSAAGPVVTIDVAANATVSNAAVAYSAPLYEPIPGPAAAQADSVASDIATLRTDFNALLAKLRHAGTVLP